MGMCHTGFKSRVYGQIFWLETIRSWEQTFAKLCVLGANILPKSEKIEHENVFFFLLFKNKTGVSGAEEWLEMVGLWSEKMV